MNQVEYTLMLQRVCMVCTGLSFVAMSGLLVFTDPNTNPAWVWFFLGLLAVFLTGFFSLLCFWWYFGLRKEILAIPEVNQLVYQSCVSATVLVFALVLQQTGQLTIWTGSLIAAVYAIYWLWLASES